MCTLQGTEAIIQRDERELFDASASANADSGDEVDAGGSPGIVNTTDAAAKTRQGNPALPPGKPTIHKTNEMLI